MPPKRRKLEDEAHKPEMRTETRVTRSSKRALGTTTAASEETLPADPRPNAPETDDTKRDTKKTKTKASSSKNEGQLSKPTSSTANFHSITISSTLTKNPTQCHRYLPPSDQAQSQHATLIFTHGAGGTLAAPAVVNFCTGICSTHGVLAFQGSMNLTARVKGFHACLEYIEREEPREPKATKQTRGNLLLGGRSMGARAAIIAAHEILTKEDSSPEFQSIRLVLVSYPLKGPKDDIRDQILLDLPAQIEVLFVIGDRDGMCPLDMLEEARGKMSAKSQLVVVRGADHGMHMKPASLEKDVGEESGRVAGRWIRGELRDDVMYIGGKEDA